jgi:hypothetical protein
MSLPVQKSRFVCRWHDPGGFQGDGKHSHLERRHYRQLRACRRSPNRKSMNIRAVLGALSIFSVRDDYRMNDPARKAVLLAPTEREEQ